MSSNFYKGEIANIMDEMIRIIDSLNELSAKKDKDIDWPPYCEATKTNIM